MKKEFMHYEPPRIVAFEINFEKGFAASEPGSSEGTGEEELD